jgi:hypothetical protein
MMYFILGFLVGVGTCFGLAIWAGIDADRMMREAQGQ